MSRSIQLPVAAPFNLAATVRLLQRRPANPIDRWEDGRYLRAMRTLAGMRLISVQDAGSVDAPELRMEIDGGPVTETLTTELSRTVRWVLGLDAPPAPADLLIEQDPRLLATLEKIRGFRPPCFPDLFTTCLGVLPFQQLSLDAGLAILGRLVERYGPCLRQADRAWYDLPAPETIAEIPVDDLVAVGLSRAKAGALRSLAELAVADDLDAVRLRSMPTADAMTELRKLPGIGPWSAGLIMLRGLRRMDVFPIGDSGAARSLARLLELPSKLTPPEADRIAEQFGDYRGYLYYLCLASRPM